MSDPIQIPRAVAIEMRDALRGVVDAADDDCGEPDCDECIAVRPLREAIKVLGAALSEDKT